MEFIKPSANVGSALQTIKSEVAVALEGAGMPRKVYVTISDAPIEGHDSVEGLPAPSSKDGRIMYNFGGKSSIKTVVGRLQGNFFLPKDGWTVDPATLKAYQTAKAERDAKRTQNAKK
jgi:hypothetical protein